MNKQYIRKLLQLCIIMLKIGCIGFGGGSALIPVIEQEVTRKSLIGKAEFDKNVIVANITPGALPVEIACGIGKKICGIPGMILSAVSIALPGTFFTVVIIALINSSNAALLRQIMFLAVGINSYIVFMLVNYASNSVKDNHGTTSKALIILMLSVFVLTSGKEFYQIIGFDKTAVFNISTVDILIIFFFVIFFTSEKPCTGNIVVCCVLTALYIFSTANLKINTPEHMTAILRIIMALCALFKIFKSFGFNSGKHIFAWKNMLWQELTWVVFLLVLSVPAMIMTKDIVRFILSGIFSAVVSFGGGDAYLAVADGLFVNSGMVDYELFYSKIITTANSLPGSILCKTLSGIGYVIGFNENGSVPSAIAVAVSGFACSVAASAGTFSAGMFLYEHFENLEIFKTVKKYIRPVIAGILLSVSLSVIYQNLQVAEINNWSEISILLLTLGIFLINKIMKRKSKTIHFYTVFVSAVISLLFCNLFLL